ncbi:MAG: hypothetical protein ACI87E_004432 [Mariniblastus sp.]|jgi:hypothetical protein
MTTTENQKSGLLARDETQRRIRAFVTTSLACFILGCLIWPLTVTSFRSVGGISLAGGTGEQAKSELQEMVSRIIHEETTDSHLDAIVSQIDAAGKLASKQIEFRDHESIRQSIRIEVNDKPDGFDFLLGYDGRGGEDERALVNLLTARVAHRLNPASNSLAGLQLETEFAVDNPNSLKIFKTAQNKSIDEATWLTDRIESDLNLIKHSLVGIGNASFSVASAGANGEAEHSPFQYASSKKPVLSTRELNNAIAAIDISSLRYVLSDIRDRVDSQAGLIEQKFESEDGVGATRLVVNKLNTSRTLPNNGAPNSSGLLLVSLISLLIGATVAMKIDPFTSRGFDNPAAVEARLGVPVIAELKNNATSTELPAMSFVTLNANRVAKASGIVLFGIFVVVLGFVVVNTDVRLTFFENPLYGCAKIVRLFAGY